MVVGRLKERKLLESLLLKEESSFVAIYGRRRVGKTFLVRSVLKDQFIFELTGLANAGTKQQLLNFYLNLTNLDANFINRVPENWLIAFNDLRLFIEAQPETDGKFVIFLDEMPWLDTKGSDFIMGLENFWNSWASARRDIVLIACGSAAAWMVNELINNHGGLHNRVTERIHLNPFTLSEVAQYLQSRKINLDNFQIIQLYMAIGGIPFYLKEIQQGLSAAQNIENMFFKPNSLLKTEFTNLFASLFKDSSLHESIIRALNFKNKGLTRKEIIRISKIKSGGTLTKTLEELELSGLITSYIPIDNKKKNTLFRLSDFYSLFWLRWVEHNKNLDDGVWINRIDDPGIRAWQGIAFEQVCISHISQIKKELGINGISSTYGSWVDTHSKIPSQIDLVIDRRDQVINLFEIKFSINKFIISKSYKEVLKNKVFSFRSGTKTNKTVFLTMITTFGVEKNEHYFSAVTNDFTMDALFEN